MQTKTGIDISYAAILLKQAEIIGIPTETVYGLAANALNENAVLKIFKTKQRPYFDPLIVHISNFNEINKIATSVPDLAYLLAERFSPGPITYILNKKDIIPDLVTAGKDTVAIRIPSHELSLELIKECGFPIAAPSANMFGYVSPVTAKDVYEQFNGKIPYILDGGPCKVGVESTIITFSKDQIIILRPGGVTIEAIKSIYSNVVYENSIKENPDAPGMLKSHYATSKALYAGTIDELKELYIDKKEGAGWILFEKAVNSVSSEQQIILSDDGTSEKAAQNLFKAMRIMDRDKKVKYILVELAPDTGLGIAINDRLRRAGNRFQ